jgi:hypothetical protein
MLPFNLVRPVFYAFALRCSESTQFRAYGIDTNTIPSLRIIYTFDILRRSNKAPVHRYFHRHRACPTSRFSSRGERICSFPLTVRRIKGNRCKRMWHESMGWRARVAAAVRHLSVDYIGGPDFRYFATPSLSSSNVVVRGYAYRYYRNMQ